MQQTLKREEVNQSNLLRFKNTIITMRDSMPVLNQRRVEITLLHVSVLMEIATSPDLGLTPSQLLEKIGGSRSTLTNVLVEMTSRTNVDTTSKKRLGWLNSEQDEEDRRYVIFSPTRLGWKVVRDISKNLQS